MKLLSTPENILEALGLPRRVSSSIFPNLAHFENDTLLKTELKAQRRMDLDNCRLPPMVQPCVKF